MGKIATIIILLIITLFSCSKKEKNNWQNNSELIGDWIKLERDNKGYLIYDPCDGNTNFIKINKDFIIYNLGHENPDSLLINEINILKSVDKIEFIGTNDFYSIKSVMRIIDFKENLFLLNWKLTPKNKNEIERIGKMMMTKKDFEKNFRFIDNPCDFGKIPEKDFLPIEYN